MQHLVGIPGHLDVQPPTEFLRRLGDDVLQDGELDSGDAMREQFGVHSPDPTRTEQADRYLASGHVVSFIDPMPEASTPLGERLG